jgi:leucyl aminopeptidase
MLEVRLCPPVPEARPVPRERGLDDLRRSAAELARTLCAPRSVFDARGLAGARLGAVVEGLVLGGYRFTAAGPAAQRRIVELAGADDELAHGRAMRAASAAVWARDLGNTPTATKTPAWLGEQAERELGAAGVQVRVHDEAWLRAHGFGGVLAVGGGSISPPRLLEATWRPRRAAARTHVVLVGKGITFDTGGLNLKPAEGMRMMHTDMCGGAAVLAALRLIAQERVPVRVTALVPAAENSISGSAMRPGDVLRHYGGRTSEIGNTDAEGRLVLADALAYAAARLRPSVLVDAATLTGAMKVALGLRTAGVFATEPRLAAALQRAGAAVGEPVWPMPLHRDYDALLGSPVADATNAPGNPGAITAALFLQPFTGGLPWAHLDIAGPARAPEDDGLFTKGATGFGARLLARWVASLG